MASKSSKQPELVDTVTQPLSDTSNLQDKGQDIPQVPVLELEPEDADDVKEWFEMASKITIMVTGETGVGKSTLLNALAGHRVFETGRENKQAVTKHVTVKNCKKGDIEIVAIDCPGLHDGTDNEDTYLQEMYEAIKAHEGIDLLLYCKSMSKTRSDAVSDADIITRLTNKLGKAIWQHTLFVLTFGNIYEKRLKQRKENVSAGFNRKKEEWKREIGETMRRCGIECRVKVCAAGFKEPQLCGKQYWLTDFWATAYKVLDENGALALLRLNQSRIVNKAPKESFQQDLDEQPLVVTNKLKKALGLIGAGGVGTAAGAAVGATIGAVCIGVISFGPAAGIGLVLGGAIGAAVGTAIGGSILALYQRRKAKKQKALAAK